ncbi:PIN domain-containing protein [Collinsella intestinalis]|uniref:PIN domain-containing protein n=1 Tax=Collinsella intestinalis TaxID=147207 RepID=UPI0025A3FA6D|nr:PIN domain-containing protein [Collinsella intestinalis]MDM8163471.1 PIN domain-containing protein [Collinsella intestinalis]
MKILFLDTNVLNGNQSFRQLFGNREEVEELSKSFKLAIPDLVIAELVSHKKKQFEKEISFFKKSSLVDLLSFDISRLLTQTFDDIKQACLDGETIPFDSCPIGDPASFQETFLPLALNNKPPFEKSSDKGYKDACIASSIMAYMKEHSDDDFFSYTKDGRLLEYLTGIEGLATFSSYKDLIEAIAPRLQSEKVLSIKRNSAENSTEKKANSDVKEAVVKLATSRSFQATHSLVQEISNNIKDLNLPDKRKILQSAVDNTQVRWLLRDPDVKELVIPIFNELSDELNDSDYVDFVNAADLPNERLDSCGNPQYSISERNAYKVFADAFINHLNTRNYDSSISTDTDNIVHSLKALIASSSLDPDRLTWESVCRCVITGGYSADASKAGRDTIAAFCDLLDSSNPEKKADIVRMLNDKFEFEVEEELPF